jgi:carboxymethylenebutenolidase
LFLLFPPFIRFFSAGSQAGDLDTGIPVATVEALKKALEDNKKTAEFKIYPGAPHGFHADYRPSYRKEAAEDGWNQMQAWFKKYGVLG